MRRIKLARILQRVSDFLPRKYPVISREGLSEEPFFIFGSGRNGSTLLNRMLNQHTGLFLPSEQYFLGNSIVKFKLYNFLVWRDLVKVISGELLKATGSHTWDFSAEEVFVALNSHRDKSLQCMIDVIFRAYAQKHKADDSIRWGDTTPLNTYYLPEIWGTFPKARYIFLVRDGRDVVASYKKGGSEYLGELAVPGRAAQHWLHAIGKYEWLQRRAEVLVVKYEDLVTEPAEQLQLICGFLGVGYQSGMLEFHKDRPVSEMYDEPQHANIRNPVSAASIGKWKEGLSAEELAQIKGINSGLKKFGYE